MGRFYNGDIKGKFWVAVQSSNDAAFFGGTECQPSELKYYFDVHDLADIESGLATCREKLGARRELLETFFAPGQSYNEQMVFMKTGIPLADVRSAIEWYARLELGEKIYACVQECGGCSFTAEC